MRNVGWLDVVCGAGGLYSVIQPIATSDWRAFLWPNLPILAACVLVWLAIHLPRQRDRRWVVAVILMVGGTVIYGVGAFLLVKTPLVPMSAKVFFQCAAQVPLPTQFPANGRIDFLMPINLPQQAIVEPQTGALGWWGGNPGSAFTQRLNPVGVAKCGVTNYEEDTIIDVEMAFEFEFREVVSERPGHMAPGKIIGSNIRKILIPRVEKGPENEFVFYLHIQHKEVVVVTPPKSLTFRRIGQSEKLTLPLESKKRLVLWPPDD